LSKATDDLDALVARMPLTSAARLLPNERRAAFYAVQTGVPQQIVAKAFGVAPATISLMATALSPKASRFYQKIAEEFKARGKKEFGETYFTQEFADRIVAAYRGHAAEPRRTAPSPAYDAFAGYYFVPTILFTQRLILIHWLETGWTFSEIAQPLEPIENGFTAKHTAHIRETNARKALLAAYRSYAQDPPNPLPRPMLWTQVAENNPQIPIDNPNS
jgi:hypothetical protein